MYRRIRSYLHEGGTRCPQCDSRLVTGVPGADHLYHCLACETTYNTEAL